MLLIDKQTQLMWMKTLPWQR